MNLKIAMDGIGGRVTATVTNFVESMYYNYGMIDCSPTKRKLLITNGGITGTVNLSMNGTATGSINFTGNYAGIYSNIVITVEGGDILPGTFTMVYNGESIPGFVFSF
jgi:hypothetical protein